MTRVLVEHPLLEAEALLKRIGSDPLTPEEVDFARLGRERLEQAIRVERNAGGSAETRPDLEEIRLHLGLEVELDCDAWGLVRGTLKEITQPAIVVVETEPLRLTKRVPLGAVRRIDLVEEGAVAA